MSVKKTHAPPKVGLRLQRSALAICSLHVGKIGTACATRNKRQSFDASRTAGNQNTVDNVTTMIPLHRLSGEKIIVNAAHIVSVELTPNTLLTLLNNQRLLVKEPAEAVCESIRAWFLSASPINLLPLQGPHVSGQDEEDEDE